MVTSLLRNWWRTCVLLLGDLSIHVNASGFNQHLMMAFDGGEALFEIIQSVSDTRLIRRIGSADASRNLADPHEALILFTRPRAIIVSAHHTGDGWSGYNVSQTGRGFHAL